MLQDKLIPKPSLGNSRYRTWPLTSLVFLALHLLPSIFFRSLVPNRSKVVLLLLSRKQNEGENNLTNISLSTDYHCNLCLIPIEKPHQGWANFFFVLLHYCPFCASTLVWSHWILQVRGSWWGTGNLRQLQKPGNKSKNHLLSRWFLQDGSAFTVRYLAK